MQMEKESMQNRKPMILVLAGPNGSGKSTRIESRVASGGHSVESSKVIDRFYKSINNIKELLEICDIMHVYDNTETPKRIIRKHKDDISIYPNEYWGEKDILELF